MHQGALQQFAEPRVVYERPANMFVAGFMGSPAMNFRRRRSHADGSPGIAVSSGATPNILKLGAADEPAYRARQGRRWCLASGPKMSHATIRSGGAAAKSVCLRRPSRWWSRRGRGDHGGAAGRRKGIDCALRT